MCISIPLHYIYFLQPTDARRMHLRDAKHVNHGRPARSNDGNGCLYIQHAGRGATTHRFKTAGERGGVVQSDDPPNPHARATPDQEPQARTHHLRHPPSQTVSSLRSARQRSVCSSIPSFRSSLALRYRCRCHRWRYQGARHHHREPDGRILEEPLSALKSTIHDHLPELLGATGVSPGLVLFDAGMESGSIPDVHRYPSHRFERSPQYCTPSGGLV